MRVITYWGIMVSNTAVILHMDCVCHLGNERDLQEEIQKDEEPGMRKFDT